MAAQEKSTRKTTGTTTKLRTKRGRKLRIKIVVAEPTEVPPADVAERQVAELVKVNSAVVRRRQKAKAAGEAAPTKAVPARAPKPPKRGKDDANKPQKRGRKIGLKTLVVLRQPGDVPAADVVKAGADQGIALTELSVHKVRRRYQDGVGATIING